MHYGNFSGSSTSITHEKLQNWNEHNNAILALKKELSTLEPALLRADKSVEKAKKDADNLDQGTCHSCGQDLPDDKKAEMSYLEVLDNDP